MCKNIRNLVSTIKTIKQNSNYRVSDIINKKGQRWEHSGNMILNNKNYNETILQKYLKINGLNNNPNFDVLFKIIEEHGQSKKFAIPEDNELVIHLRMGDVVSSNKFVKKKYIKLINDMLVNNSNLNKITIVTCFSYSAWSKSSLYLRTNEPLWEYTEEKQKKNIKRITQLLNDIKKNFPTMDLNIYSNRNIDKDMCYCVLAKHFIPDQRGFSNLCFQLHNLNSRV